MLLVIGLLPAMFPMALAAEKEPSPVVIQAADTKAVTIDPAEFTNGTWNIDGAFRQIHPDLTKGGFWNSTKSGSYNKVITGESNSPNFFATPRFTRDDLPVGSVIVVEAGWQYRPEGWVTDSLQTKREGNVTQMFVQITEEWWGNYTLRAFNISKTDGTSLSDRYQSDIYEAFRIYVPDEYVALGYERFYPKLEHCAYYDCTKNKIFTRNSATDAQYYFTTQRLTKSQLPVGSIVIMEKGWQNRPEAWLDDAPQATRPDNTTQNFLEITEEWWGNYIRRSFTLSRTNKASMVNVTTEEIHDIFRIYVPKKTTTIEGLSDEETNATTKIHQLPSRTPIDGGDYEKTMSYILESREGKIIVIDGGYQTGNHDGKYLFAYLQRITGKAKPHVDAWFFTHPHADHFAAYLTVANLYANQITVDAAYHRFPTAAQAEKYHNKTADPTAFGKYYDKLVTHTAKLKTAKGETTPLIEVNARHTGKCNSSFDFDEIHIDILLTCEDAYWAIDNITTKYSGTLEQNGKSYTSRTLKQIASTNANESCMVFRATFHGKSVLFLGDGSIVTEVMLTRYHEANATDSSKYFNLKSDIVQVSHHGVQSMGKAIYGLINPNEALWCTPYHIYASRPGDYLTTYYIRQWFRTTYATTNYVTYDGVDVLEFPVIRSAAAVSIPAELKPYVFNATYYAERYADLKEAYGTDEAKLYKHFINYGIEEGRCASPFFDVRYYMNYNSQNFQEIMKGDYEKAFKHFLSNYKSTTLMKLSPDFDPGVYQGSHKDLTTQFALLQHYAANGYLTGELASKAYISAAGHTYHKGYTETPYQAPTCTANGVTMGAICSACGEAFASREVIPALGHSYEAVDTVLSCEEGSYIPDTAFFVNFTGKSDRYSSHAIYSKVNYDSASNWSYLDARYQTPVVDTAAGTLKTGFEAAGYNHLWIMTGPSYNEGYNLKYQPKSDHMIKVRIRFDGLKVMSGKTNAYLRFNYFVGPDRYEGMGDKVERMYTMDSVKITPAQLACGEFVTLTFPVSGLDSTSHTTITALRFQVGDLESTNSAKPGSIVVDYIYVGPDTVKLVSYLCTTCGHTYTEDHVDSLGHKKVVHEGVAPTCTEGGLSSWQDCTRCGKVLAQQEELPPLGHHYETEEDPATCFEPGYVNSTCVGCGDSYVIEELPALGHRYRGVTTPPTCTEDGYTTYSCVGCEEGYVADPVPAPGHEEVTDKGTASTCTVGGMSDGSHCDRCGQVLIKQEALPPLGHSYETLEATPNCTVGAVIPETAFFANFTGKSDRYSSHAIYSKVNYDSASNWSYLDARYQTPVVDTATGTLKTGFEAAGYNHLWIMTGPSYNEGYSLKYQPKSDHVIKVRIRFDGLKVMTGKTNAYLRFNYFVGPDRYEGMGDKVERMYAMDSVKVTPAHLACGEFVTLTFPVSGLDSTSHTTITALRFQVGDLESTNSAKPGSITVDYLYLGPEKGSPVTYMCSSCGHSYTVDSLEPSAHSYEAAVTAPTCTEQGYTTYTCSRCDHSYEGDYVAATGHAEVIDQAVGATCTATGLAEGKHCGVCGEILVAQGEIPALGHSYTQYTDRGEDHSLTCSHCGDWYSEAHSYEDGQCACGAVEITEPAVVEDIQIYKSLNLASDISINYIVNQVQLDAYDSFFMECVVPVYEGNQQIGESTYRLEPVKKDYFYYFILEGLIALQMNDTVSATVHMTKDGKEFVTPATQYSVATYAYNQLNKDGNTDSLKKLCADLLRYGATAQTWKGYRTDAPADSAMTDAHKAYLTDLSTVSFRDHKATLEDFDEPLLTWASNALSLESRVVVRFVFRNNGYEGELQALSLRLSYTDCRGVFTEVTLRGAREYAPNTGLYVFDFEDLPASEMRSVLSAVIYEGDTRLSQTRQYSVDTYGIGKTGMVLTLNQAMIAYGDSATAYFTN